MKPISVAILVAAMTMAIPSPVAAGFGSASCDYNATNHKVTISIVDSLQADISRDEAGRIRLEGAWCDNLASVTNTDEIVVTGDSGAQSVHLDLANKGFRPGFTNEPGKSDEIEFFISLGAGSDSISIMGSGSSDKIDIGQVTTQFFVQYHINLNSRESTGVDTDINLLDVEGFSVNGMGGNDRIRATGKAQTGPEPLGLTVGIQGGEGDDLIKGGAGADIIFADGGVDVVYGKGGNDTIYLTDATPGDIAYGGPGTDTCVPDAGDNCNE